LFAEDAPIVRGAPQRRSSSPQRDEPPALMVGVMRWMPRPSLRGMVIGGALVGAFLAMRQRKQGVWVETEEIDVEFRDDSQRFQREGNDARFV
jgi:hypothetical protein